jgi:ABC-type polysaccharide transport system permease subunit
VNARTVNTLPATRLSNFRRKFVRSIPYYVMILLPLAYLLVFKYYPMYGV